MTDTRVSHLAVARASHRSTGGSEFFLAHYDTEGDPARTLSMSLGLGQFEVGMGIVPGGGTIAPLPRMIGRGRALEVLLVADDIDAALAERYGYVNRVVPDDELEQETDRMARRVASFDKQAIAETKALVDAASLPDDAELPPALTAFFASAGRPAAQARAAALAAQGHGQDGELERRLGELVGLAGAPPDANGNLESRR
jgi:hypothetical protein